jgi:hypothetical protein
MDAAEAESYTPSVADFVLTLAEEDAASLVFSVRRGKAEGATCWGLPRSKRTALRGYGHAANCPRTRRLDTSEVDR